MKPAIRVAAFCGALACATAFAAPVATLDSVDVQVVDDEIIGIRDGSPATRRHLQKGEEIQWMGARGTVAGVLTDRRFFAMSSTSAGWQEIRLDRSDGGPRVELGANVLVCITAKRILGFPGLVGVLSEDRLQPGEILVDSDANEHVAVLVTDRRAVAYSSGSGRAADVRFGVRERFESLKTLATTATVRTSERLVVFSHASGGWSEELF